MVINPPKCSEYDYINFVIATPSVYSCTEAARVQPLDDNPPAHDSLNRLLYRLPADSEALWTEAQPAVKTDQGILVIDDSTLDKMALIPDNLLLHHQLESGRESS